MHRFQQLLVGLANQPADEELLHYAAAIVRLGTVRAVHCVHVLPGQGPSDRALEQVRTRVQRHFPPGEARVAVSCAVLEGPVEDQLLAMALERKADLVVVGHGQGRSGRKSLARRLAMKAPCSVWMVPAGSRPVLQRILVPVDFSEPSADALAVAAELVRLQGSGELLSLHVYFNDAVATFADYVETLRSREEEILRAFDDRFADLGHPIRPLVEQGAHVAHVITRTAEQHDVDLLILSTRGRSRSAAVLLGSVTEDVIVETHLPLLVVKHFGAQLCLLQALLKAHEQGPKPHYN